MYCRDCRAEVEISVRTDWMGDADGMYGEWPIYVWECIECGGSDLREKDEPGMIGKYCIVRAYGAGVFAGTVTAIDGKSVTMADTRRLWYWDGAASLSQLAMEGTKSSGNCKFAVPVNEILLTDAIEVIPATEQAKKSILEVPEWKR